MSLPDVVSREQWLAARKELLAKEKELTRARDALNTERRMLPMVEIDKPYVFEGPSGDVDAARPLRGPPPADPHPLHVRPRLGGRLPELHAGADEIAPGLLAHLHARETSLALRRPRAAGQDRALQGQAGLDLPALLVLRQRLQLRLPCHARRVGGTRGVQLPHARGARAGGHGVLHRGRSAARAARPEPLPARRRSHLSHLLDLRARRRDDGRLVLLPRPQRPGRQEEWEEPKGRAVDPHGATPDFAT